MTSIAQAVPAGVVTGKNLKTLLENALDKGFVIPTVQINCSSACTLVLEYAQHNNIPVGISIQSPSEKRDSSIDKVHNFVINLALHVREASPGYGIPVILQTEHCTKHLTDLEDLLRADRDHYKRHGEPLFSSHALNLNLDSIPHDVDAICAKYFADHFIAYGLWLEMNLGVVASHHNHTSKLFELSLKRVWNAYSSLIQIGDRFLISMDFPAATFNNFPDLHLYQDFCQSKIMQKRGADSTSVLKPIFFAVDANAASKISVTEVSLAAQNGVVKMNLVSNGSTK